MLSSNFNNKYNSSISYSIEGNKQDGVCLFFLNGMFKGKESWIKQIRSRRLQKYKLIFMDYPGFGDAALPEQYNDYMTLVINNMCSIIDNEKEEKVYIIGYSLGGVFACWFAALHPDKIKALILISSGFFLSTYMKVIVNQSLNLLSSSAEFSLIYPYIYIWQYSENYLERLIDYESHKKTNGNDYIKDKKALRDQMIIASELERYRSCVNKIKCPGLMIGGNRDMVMPFDRQKKIFDGKEKFEFKSIPDASHSTIIENYQDVNGNLNDFLLQSENQKRGDVFNE